MNYKKVWIKIYLKIFQIEQYVDITYIDTTYDRTFLNL